MDNTVKKRNKVLKKTIVVCVVIGVVIMAIQVIQFLDLIGALDRPNKGKIFDIVEENHGTLIEYIQTGNMEYPLDIPGVKGGIKEKRFIDFPCGNSGIGSETSYWGFYYSAENDVNAAENIYFPEGAWVSPHRNGYLWKEADGDNSFYVEEIMENFFYYECHY